ncbi:MAG: hypothetical protein WDN69_26840 [Aliidongia sp.]
MSPLLTDFADTAALLGTCDLLIAVDLPRQPDLDGRCARSVPAAHRARSRLRIRSR